MNGDSHSTARTCQPTLHDVDAVDHFRRVRRIDPDRVRRMRYALYRGHESVPRALERLRPADADAFASKFVLAPLAIAHRFDSQLDRSSKFIMRASDGATFETVLLRAAAGRKTVCVSTQVGCGAGCPFCATARMGLRRNLTAAEIVEQVLTAARLSMQEGQRLRNVVFMGMGEPLDNESALHEAIALLLDDQGCSYPPRRVLVSTVGLPEAMRSLVDRFPGVQLAVSLHSARADLRRRLVPWSHPDGHGALRDALHYVATRPRVHRHQGPVMIEHIMIAGINDTDEDALALIDFLHGIDAHVNLIPYNQVDHAPDWRPTPRKRRDEFAELLRRAGIFTTIRYSMGADIGAACGQLIQP